MSAETPQPSLPSHPQLVLLLTAIVFISYVDRGNLATAAPLLKEELELDAAQLGLLFSVFFWSYVACMIPAGWAAERYGAHRVLAVGAALWAAATLLTGFAGGMLSLVLLRLLLGVGESVVFPSCSSLLATHLPASQLGFANGLIVFGLNVGPAFGTFVGGLMMAEMGWRPVFIVFGAVSLLWLLPWSRFVAIKRTVTPVRHSTLIEGSPDFRRLVRERALWGASLGHFSVSYGLYFFLSFLPLYLVEGRGFSMAVMAQVAGGSYFVSAVAALFGGWCFDRWASSGGSATTIYKAAMVTYHAVGIATTVGLVLLPVREAIVCLFVGSVIQGLSSPGVFAIGQTLAGPRAAGRWIGVQNFCGNLAGPIAPMLTGLLVASSGNYVMAFGVAALVNVLGIVGWGLILQKVEPIDWNPARQRA